MILLDSLYINNSGGKVLLDYLVNELQKANVDVFYLFDERLKDTFQQISSDRKIYLKASFYCRLKFYFNTQKLYSIILCFGNVPPLFKIGNALVYTYFHNSLILNYPKDYPLKQKIYVILQSIFLQMVKNHTNYWIVQTLHIAEELSSRFNINGSKIKIIPFFHASESPEHINKKTSFIYASSGAAHKNMGRLLSAWEELSQEGYNPPLHLTLSGDWIDLIRRIQALNRNGLNIINHGIIPADKLKQLYQLCEYMIYPSLTESFGLPLIEATKSGCKIIAADLPYTYAVIKPSLTFDPYNVNSIKRAVEVSLKNILPNSECLVNNEISNILGLVS